MYKEKIPKKKLPRVNFTRFGHRSHAKGARRLIANKSFSKSFRKKIESALHNQCKRLERELVKGVSK